MVWDAYKSGLRREVISFAGFHRKKQLELIRSLMLDLSRYETEHMVIIVKKQTQRQSEIELKVISTKAKINGLFNQSIAERFQTSRQDHYEYGEKTGKHLALRIRQKTATSSITKLKRKDGTVSSDPNEIVNIFQDFYQDLYKSRHQTMVDPGTRSLPVIQELEGDILMEEVNEVLLSMASGKAAGPDGLPMEIYKILHKELAPLLWDLFLAVQQKGTPPKSWEETSIVIFLKKGKSADDPASYRPITLINTDKKLYSKILARRLSKVLDSLVSPWQHGFIPGRSTTDHIKRVISLFNIAESSGQQMSLILLDAQKAFDQVEWGYLWQNLRSNGFGPRILTALRPMYAQSYAKIQLMGQHS